MSAYELRRHLEDAHGLRLAGLAYDGLLAIHDDEHRGATDHTHDDEESVW